MNSPEVQIILMDNGSLKAAATLQLRRLAEQLSEACGLQVDAVSLRHADRIPPALLHGMQADILPSFVERKLATGHRHFIVVPLFFALSAALTQYLPRQLETLKQRHGEFSLTLADVIYPLPQGEPALLELMLQQLQLMATASKQVVLVDHGSPDAQVTAVRQHLAQQLRQRLGANHVLDEAVMERREGAQYDFNGALLETLLQRKAQQGVRDIDVLLQFFLPGRHAGKGGDIETICQRVERLYPSTTIHLSALVAQNALLIPVLRSRLQAVLDKHSCQNGLQGSD